MGGRAGNLVRNKKSPRGSPEAFVLQMSQELYFTDVLRLQSLITPGDFEFNAVSLVQTFEAIRLDSRKVDEYVFATVLRDESKTLLILEPLHCTLCHAAKPLLHKI